MLYRRYIKKHSCLFFLIFLLICASAVFSDDGSEDRISISFHGVLDLRLAQTDRDTSWLDGGFGKPRYGGEENDRRTLLRLPQASGVLFVRVSDTFSARVQVNLDADPDPLDLRSPVDVIESFASFHPVLSPHWRWKTRGGFFFPPVSLENRGTAWTSPYTISTSAINSWIGEEVRVTGVETGFVYSGAHELSFRVAIFGNNDPTGTLLAWRGWALHDRQSGLTDRLPLATIPAIGPNGLFPEQPNFVEPFREVDGRPGYYGAFSSLNAHYEFNILYFDNRGDPEAEDGVQYAWDTKFTNAGLSVPVGEHWEILTQYMSGRSRMGPGDMVKIDFLSWYVLLTTTFGSNRVTARFDNFRVRDLDEYVDIDNNNEHGSAWTLAYMYPLHDRYRLAFEILRVNSSRPIREVLDLSKNTTDMIFQTSFRFTF